MSDTNIPTPRPMIEVEAETFDRLVETNARVERENIQLRGELSAFKQVCGELVKHFKNWRAIHGTCDSCKCEACQTITRAEQLLKGEE